MLNYREEVIAAKVDREHNGEALGRELELLRSQLLAEQQQRSEAEESMMRHIDELQEQLGMN